jgi:uncharacterized repeat protein (TIGR02543 family)
LGFKENHIIFVAKGERQKFQRFLKQGKNYSKEELNMRKKLLSMLLMLSMLFTMLPFPAMAEEADIIGEKEEIIAFAPLKETEKTVAAGTSIEDLELPETLTAAVRTDTVTEKLNGFEYEETLVDIPAVWTSQPEYLIDTAGEYVFTPIIEGFTLAGPVELPQIIVTVEEAILRETVSSMSHAEYNIWVAGVQVTDANKDNITAPGITKGEVIYDSDTNTLTLTDATIIYNGNVVDTYIHDLIILLNGENIVTSTSAVDDNAFCTRGWGDFTFKGDGSLEASGKYSGIYAFGDINIEGGTITATGEKVGISTNSGHITIIGGNVTAIATTTGSATYHGYGIAKDHNRGLTLTVSGDAEVTARGIRGAIGPYDKVTINTTHSIKAGDNESNADIVIVPDESTWQMTYIQLIPGNTISGKITDKKGNPIAGATLQIQKDGADFGMPVATGADGTYTTQSVPNGNYTIKVSKSRYLDTVIEDVNVNNSPITGIDAILNLITYPNWEAAAVTAVEDTDYERSGDIYAIHTAKGMAWFAKAVNDGDTFAGKVVELANDIDLEDVPVEDYDCTEEEFSEKITHANSWIPIGKNKTGFSDAVFSGTFDGKGHTVSGVKINSTGTDRVADNDRGLFGHINNATIKNLGVVNSHVIFYNTGGGIVGYIHGENSLMKNCYFDGVVGPSRVYMGGLAGANEGTVQNSYNRGNISGTSSSIGGLVGYNKTSGVIENCYNIGTVEGGNAGSLVGDNSGNIRYCYWLEGSLTEGLGYNYGSGENIESMTEADMKKAAGEENSLINKLNSWVYEKNDSTYRAWVPGLDGYPVLQIAELCKVTFDANGHGTAPDGIIAVKDSTIALPTAPTTSGYKFDGWFTKDGAGDDWGAKFTETTTVTGDITIYAKWTENPTFTITVLDGGHGTASANLTSAEEGTEITLTATPNSGYIFKEWSSTESLTFTEGSKYTAAAKFIMPGNPVILTANWEYSSSGSGGGSGSGGSSANNTISINVIPPSPDMPDSPTQGEIKVSGTVDNEGKVIVNITEKYVTDMYNKAMEDAKKRGNEQNGITLVFRVETGSRTASGITVNLPKTVQEFIIAKKIVNIIIVVDNPDIRISMDLETIKEINRQAESDVNVEAVRGDRSKLTGEARRIIGNRPVFDLKVNHSRGKQIQNFGTGTVSITIPYNLDENEKAENIRAVYIDDNGKVHWLDNSAYDKTEKAARFSTNHFSLYGVGYMEEALTFIDIAGHWAKEDIEYVIKQGLFSGTSSDTFSPNMAMTRGMFVTVLGRMAKADVISYKESSFTDVKSDAYYMGYIEWASKNGIVNGIGNKEFAPDKSITREQMAAIMQNYAKYKGLTLAKVNKEKTFADSKKISTYAGEAVKEMQMAGIISGKEGNLFDPQGTATRAEVSSVLRRFVELTASKDTM